jgi:hypothetical protein
MVERDDGLTDLANLALVCCYHPHLIHDNGWKLGPKDDHTWLLTRPNGTAVKPPRYRGRTRSPASPRCPQRTVLPASRSG